MTSKKVGGLQPVQEVFEAGYATLPITTSGLPTMDLLGSLSCDTVVVVFVRTVPNQRHPVDPNRTGLFVVPSDPL